MPAATRFRVRAPYRFNPLGAHVDHQGGDVLARTLELCTELVGRPLSEPRLKLVASLHGVEQTLDARFDTPTGAGDPPDGQQERWRRYALGAARVLARRHRLSHGLDARVDGSMVAAGLSSSASFLLALLAGLAEANGLALSNADLVDAVREVEHEHLGLTNGLQDQLSIVHGRRGCIAQLSMDDGTASHVPDPVGGDVRWLLCFSGVSRELVGSGFNTRVAECGEAAGWLQAGAHRLADVAPERRDLAALHRHAPVLARRARHVYSEMMRVRDGAAAWRAGDVARFGQLMNVSCKSSIEDYESGSEYLVALQGIAGETSGVLGSRFSGGGYGGCLVMLVQAAAVDEIGASVLAAYLSRYPDMTGIAHCFVAGDAGGVEVSAA